MRKHIVNEDAVRSARPDGTCFYCRAAVGAEHIVGCVLRRKTVRFRVVTVYEKELPEHWTKYDCEFWANDGSWCVSSMWNEKAESDDCGCSDTEMKVIDEYAQKETT